MCALPLTADLPLIPERKRAWIRTHAMLLLHGLLAACLLLSLPGQAADKPVAVPYENVIARQLPFEKPSATILGQPYTYPKGAPAVSLFMIELPPGKATNLHKHQIPLIAYVISGSVEVDYGSKGKRTITAGQGYVEAIDWCHVGRAVGKQPATLLGVYLGEANPQRPLATPCTKTD